MFPKGYEEMTYVEPFVGAGHVFYGKEPSEKEIINDKDTGLTMIHRGLKKFSGELHGPYSVSRQRFNQWKEMKPRSDKDRFMREWVLSKFSYAGDRMSYDPAKSPPIKMDMDDYTNRLKDVVILNRDYKALILKYDGPNTLFYFDPPYDESERTAKYKHSAFSLEEMKPLLDKIQGKFILTYNDVTRVRKLFSGYNVRGVSVKYTVPTPHIGKELIISNF